MPLRMASVSLAIAAEGALAAVPGLVERRCAAGCTEVGFMADRVSRYDPSKDHAFGCLGFQRPIGRSDELPFADATIGVFK